jgi:hypothetical protein
MLFKLKLFFGKCAAGSGKSGVAIWPALTTVTAALSPAVAAQRARRSLHSASKRAPQGRGSGRGRRTSNTRTRAGEVVLPGGRVHMGCLPPTPRIPPRRRRLRACLWRFGPVLEFGLGRCPRLCCGCWPWFPGAFRGGFRAGVFLTGAVRSGDRRLGGRAGVRTVHSGEGDVYLVRGTCGYECSR